MARLSERLEEYTRPFRIAAAVIGALFVTWLCVNFFLRDNMAFSQWCGGRPVAYKATSLVALAEKEGTKPFLINFCNPNLLWSSPDTIRVPNRWWVLFLVIALLLMLTFAFITTQRWWGLYLLTLVVLVHKIFSGAGWSVCFGRHLESGSSTDVAALAVHEHVPAMTLRMCNLLFFQSQIPLGMDLTIPNLFGAGFAIVLVIAAFLPPVWELISWFVSRRKGRRGGMNPYITLLLVGLAGMTVAGCERGLPEDGNVPVKPANTSVSGGSATLVPPLQFPTRPPSRPTAVRPERTDENTAKVDFNISTQNVCYPSIEDSISHKIDNATRIGNKLSDGSECHGSSTQYGPSDVPLSVLDFMRSTKGDMGFVIMNKDLSISPVIELEAYLPGKAYLIDLDGTIFFINRDPISGEHVLMWEQDGEKPMATPIPLPEATIDPASLVNWSTVDPKTVLNAAMKDICIDTYNQQKDLSMGDLLLWNDGSRLGIENADDWGCVSIAISPDQRFIAFSYVCPTCADPDQRLMALKFDLRNITNGPEIIERTLIAHIDSAGGFSPSGVRELPEFRNSGRGPVITTPTTGPK